MPWRFPASSIHLQIFDVSDQIVQSRLNEIGNMQDHESVPKSDNEEHKQ